MVEKKTENTFQLWIVHTKLFEEDCLSLAVFVIDDD